ncbi:hypothetical protein GCM10010399_04720 [Dactylosporangium fulvum]
MGYGAGMGEEAGVPGPIGPLTDALAALVDFDPSTLDDAAVREATLLLLRSHNQLDAAITRFLGVFDDRRLSRRDAYGSTKRWLEAFGRLSGPAASSRMRAVEITRLLPDLEEAFEAGEVSSEHVNRIGLTAEEVGDDVIEQVEQTLVPLARQFDPHTLHEACAYLRDAALRDKNTPPDQQYLRRGVTLTRLGDMWKLRGILDTETGALLSAGLDAFTKAPAPDDDRNPAQRRHDGLADLLTATLRDGRAPAVGGGLRPHIALLMPVRRYVQLHDHGDDPDGTWDGCGDDGPAVLSEWGPVPDGLASRLSCDAMLQPIWLHPDNGVPLKLGRAYRNTPPALRRALAARDPHCRWPGCRMPANWCDSHHLREWIRDHGETDIDNLVLLCRYHHVCVHERGWSLRRDPGNGWIIVIRPDGTPYELGPSRPRSSAVPYGRGGGGPPPD